jgi:hypothetical protein
VSLWMMYRVARAKVIKALAAAVAAQKKISP